METKKSKKFIMPLILIVVVLAALARITYLFAYEKEGVHSDEVWSYGLANGYREPYIFTNYDQNEDKYVYEWIKGETLNDYLTVQEGEAFAYGSVLYNLKSDNHPPLYFFALHTICSFFPDQYSRWFGYAINIVVFLILSLYLFLLAKKLTGEAWIGILVVAAYGFGTMGVDTFLFVRHYAMVALFIVMTIYHTLKLLEAEKSGCFIRRAVVLLFVMIGGCLTHYEYVPFLAVFGILVLIRYIKRKEYVRMWWYGGACAVSAGVLMVATGVVTRLLMRVNNTEFDGTKAEDSMVQDGATFFEDVISNVKLTIYDITGVNLSDKGATMVLVGLAVLLVILVVSFIVLVRLTKSGKIKFLAGKKLSVNGFVVIATAVATLGFLIFVTATCSQKNMGIYANRYLFPVYPIFSLAIVGVVWVVVRAIYAFCESRILRSYKRVGLDDEVEAAEHKEHVSRASLVVNIVVTIVIVVYTAINVAHAEMIYLFPRDNEAPRMEDYTKDKDVALFLSEHWLITTYTDLLRGADDIYIAHAESKDDIKKADLGEHKVDYVVFDATRWYYGIKWDAADDEDYKRNMNESYYMKYLEGVIGAESLEYVQSDWVFARRVYIYKVNY